MVNPDKCIACRGFCLIFLVSIEIQLRMGGGKNGVLKHAMREILLRGYRFIGVNFRIDLNDDEICPVWPPGVYILSDG